VPGGLSLKRVEPRLLQAVIEVRVKDASLPDAGAAPAAPESTTDKAKPKKVKKKFDNAVPKAILEFHDVSNDADGEYEVRRGVSHCCNGVSPSIFCVDSNPGVASLGEAGAN
jgi:hypothetical protein